MLQIPLGVVEGEVNGVQIGPANPPLPAVAPGGQLNVQGLEQAVRQFLDFPPQHLVLLGQEGREVGLNSLLHGLVRTKLLCLSENLQGVLLQDAVPGGPALGLVVAEGAQVGHLEPGVLVYLGIALCGDFLKTLINPVDGFVILDGSLPVVLQGENQLGKGAGEIGEMNRRT